MHICRLVKVFTSLCLVSVCCSCATSPQYVGRKTNGAGRRSDKPAERYSHGRHSGETVEPIQRSDADNRATIIRPEDAAGISLATIKTMAVAITSTSPLHGETAAKILKSKLRNHGYRLLDQDKLAKSTRERLEKGRIETLKDQILLTRKLKEEKEGTGSALDILEKRLTLQLQKAVEQQKQDSNLPELVELGRELGLDALIVGTLFEGRRQMSFPNASPPQSIESVGASSIVVQVLHVESQRSVLTIALDYEKGESVIDAVDKLSELLVQRMHE